MKYFLEVLLSDVTGKILMSVTTRAWSLIPCTEVGVFTKDVSYLRFVGFIRMLFSDAAAGFSSIYSIEGHFYCLWPWSLY